MTFPRIVALDMDGTLVDPHGDVPEEFWPVLEEAKTKNMVIAPASGRQLATLQDMFAGRGIDTFIAENGGVVWHRGDIIATKPMDKATVDVLLRAVAASKSPVHPVACTPEFAFVAQNTPEHPCQEISKYYHSRRPVPSLIDAVADFAGPAIKVSLFVETDAEKDGLPLTETAASGHTIAVSGAQWVDVMSPDTNKGNALKSLADSLGIDITQTAAIGDYLNDYDMLVTAGTAVAMANGHDKLKAIADIIAPSNADHGAITQIKEWLAQ